MKDWIKNLLILITIWSLSNALFVGFYLSIKGKFMGETNFFRAFASSTLLDLIALLFILAIFYAAKSLITSIAKGLKKEKDEDPT